MSCFLGLALSLHVGFSQDYNGVHPGFHCQHSEKWTSGIYYNSEENPSVYSKLRFGKETWLDVGLVTGYSEPVLPFIRVGYENIFIAPSYEVSSERIGVIIGYEINFN